MLKDLSSFDPDQSHFYPEHSRNLALAQKWLRTKEHVALPPPKHFGAFVLKIVSGCNLACQGCYQFPKNDQLQILRESPGGVPLEGTLRAVGRIAEYAAEHELPLVDVGFHGGEPLLAGADYLDAVAGALKGGMRESSPDTKLRLNIQTNGLRFTRDIIEVLRKHEIGVGISLDGDKKGNDRNRVDHAGRGTFERIDHGIKYVVKELPELFNGLLCVIDIKNDPIATYKQLMSYNPPMIDFLIPYATWDEPPPGHDPWQIKNPYADWLCAVFDKWCTEKPATDIRLFSSILSLLQGGAGSTDTIGPDMGSELVINGPGYELVDALTMVYEGAAKTSFNIHEHDIETVANAMRAGGYLGRKKLPGKCQECPFVASHVCGGGHIATRYSSERGFDRESVFCGDLGSLIQHIRSYLTGEIAGIAAHKRHREERGLYLQRRGDSPVVRYINGNLNT